MVSFYGAAVAFVQRRSMRCCDTVQVLVHCEYTCRNARRYAPIRSDARRNAPIRSDLSIAPLLTWTSVMPWRCIRPRECVSCVQNTHEYALRTLVSTKSSIHADPTTHPFRTKDPPVPYAGARPTIRSGVLHGSSSTPALTAISPSVSGNPDEQGSQVCGPPVASVSAT